MPMFCYKYDLGDSLSWRDVVINFFSHYSSVSESGAGNSLCFTVYNAWQSCYWRLSHHSSGLTVITDHTWLLITHAILQQLTTNTMIQRLSIIHLFLIILIIICINISHWSLLVTVWCITEETQSPALLCARYSGPGALVSTQWRLRRARALIMIVVHTDHTVSAVERNEVS